jgi:hypothetical protein
MLTFLSLHLPPYWGFLHFQIGPLPRALSSVSQMGLVGHPIAFVCWVDPYFSIPSREE